MDTDGKVVPHVYCIGDANGKLMLAHAASAQGISAVETMVGREHVLNHLSVPAACFTHPEARAPSALGGLLWDCFEAGLICSFQSYMTAVLRMQEAALTCHMLSQLKKRYS